MSIRRIGVLTGGGDVPGLNACIKAVVEEALPRGWEVIGLRRGWEGPLFIDPADPASVDAWTIRLDAAAVRVIDRLGGTMLHTSRTDPANLPPREAPAFLNAAGDKRFDATPHVLRVIQHLGLDALIAMGGDGTLRFASRLAKEGVRVISIPKTMDNDVFGTDYAIGFSTAVSRSVEFITALRSTAASHERIAVVELFGRLSGETALVSGLLSAADRVVIAEVPYDPARVCDLLVADRAANPSGYAIAVISEGARPEGGQVSTYGEADAYGRKRLGGVGHELAESIRERSGLDAIVQNLAYLMRSGPPDSLDRMAARCYGTMAVQLLAEGHAGLMCAVRDGNYTTVPGDTCLKGKRRVDVDALYDVATYRPRIATVRGKPLFLN